MSNEVTLVSIINLVFLYLLCLSKAVAFTHVQRPVQLIQLNCFYIMYYVISLSCSTIPNHCYCIRHFIKVLWGTFLRLNGWSSISYSYQSRNSAGADLFCVVTLSICDLIKQNESHASPGPKWVLDGCKEYR